MKKILITGENSYLGQALNEWLSRQPEKYSVETIDMRDGTWQDRDFSAYDVIFHAAGIAHSSSNSKTKDLYFRVNRDLAYETAKKAGKQAVKQFVFMSSILVYGSETTLIDKNTAPNPGNYYAQSKLEAEQLLETLASPDFKIVILRSPMIYGKNSKGNYRKLSQLVRKIRIFPDIPNQRSMLHIDNFTEFVKLMIDNEESGLFFPQNEDYVTTSHMVSSIGRAHGKKIKLTRLFNPVLKLMKKNKTVNKLFGSLAYEKSMSLYDKGNYQIRDFDESIRLSEKSS